jgi:anti-sigma factor RsiW
MSCEKMAGRILGYLDGRLNESERLEAEKHLAACAACRLRVNEFRAVSGLLDELPVIEPSPEFDVRVHARVAAEPVKESWWAWLRVPPRVAFAASMLLLAAIWMGYYQRPQQVQLPWSDPVEADAQMMQDLPVLEDHDVLSNFEPLKDLPGKADDDSDNVQQPQQQPQQM